MFVFYVYNLSTNNSNFYFLTSSFA